MHFNSFQANIQLQSVSKTSELFCVKANSTIFFCFLTQKHCA